MNERVPRSRPPVSALKMTYEQMLSNDIRPILKARGFAKAHATFRRRRGPLYDMIGFQSDRYNGVAPGHTFFINVGVGSVDVDAIAPSHGSDATPPTSYILKDRWQYLVSDLPAELSFDHRTDMAAFTAELRTGLDQVLDVVDSIDSTQQLVHWAITRNTFVSYKKLCRYLAETGDIEVLRGYIQQLHHSCRNDEPRWAIFNRKIAESVGPLAPTLIQEGLLDPVNDAAPMWVLPPRPRRAKRQRPR